MDRVHRIGQEKPVLVFRLATANSVEGRMLRRANSKLMLERLVIRKGAFLPRERGSAASLSNEELMELLQDSVPLKDEPQAGIVSDEVSSRGSRLDLKALSARGAGPPPPAGAAEAAGSGAHAGRPGGTLR